MPATPRRAISPKTEPSPSVLFFVFLLRLSPSVFCTLIIFNDFFYISITTFTKCDQALPTICSPQYHHKPWLRKMLLLWMMFAMTMVMMMMAWVTHIVASCSMTTLGLDAILVIIWRWWWWWLWWRRWWQWWRLPALCTSPCQCHLCDRWSRREGKSSVSVLPPVPDKVPFSWIQFDTNSFFGQTLPLVLTVVTKYSQNDWLLVLNICIALKVSHGNMVCTQCTVSIFETNVTNCSLWFSAIKIGRTINDHIWLSTVFIPSIITLSKPVSQSWNNFTLESVL